jgi:hypothetical protein
LGESAVLQANVAGTDDDTGFGVIEVVGNLALGASSLEIAAEGAYAPQLGDTFPIITAGGGISGSISLGAAPDLPEVLAWDLDVEASRIILSVVPALAGDYNADGAVDAADYIVWRKLLNSGGSALPADGDDNNIVNAADYDVWRTNFGRTVGGGSGATGGAPSGSSAVPEPAGIFFVLTALLAAVFCRRAAANPGC